MTCLKPGFVPHGWVRGHAICVEKAYPDRLGCVYGGVPISSWIEANWPQTIDPLTIGRIDFSFEDAPSVDAWIKWWQEPHGGAR